MPSLKNDGVLNLDHSEIKSTNDPVIQNNGQLNIIGNKISLIKKLWLDITMFVKNGKESNFFSNKMVLLCHLQKSKSITLSSKCNGPGKCIGYFGS